MFALERFLEQRIVEEINLTDRQVVGGAPISVDLTQQVWREVGLCSRLRRPGALGLRSIRPGQCR
jgi:hypothetical protein